MNEFENQKEKLELTQNDHIAEMTRDERVVFLSRIIFIVVITIIFLTATLFENFTINKNIHPENLSSERYLLVFIFIMFATFLCGSIIICFKIIQSKIKTGSYLPKGERLVKWLNVAVSLTACGESPKR